MGEKSLGGTAEKSVWCSGKEHQKRGARAGVLQQGQARPPELNEPTAGEAAHRREVQRLVCVWPGEGHERYLKEEKRVAREEVAKRNRSGAGNRSGADLHFSEVVVIVRIMEENQGLEKALEKLAELLTAKAGSASSPNSAIT
jgi:hypothetical protein